MSAHDAVKQGAVIIQRTALAYAWGTVCFSSWDDCLAQVALLSFWDLWPTWLRCVLHALYPAYFVYASSNRLAGPEGPTNPANSRRYLLLCAVACAIAAVRGTSAGKASRQQSVAGRRGQ